MTTTTIPPPPPQPQQSTAYPTLLKCIDELEQHMANLLQYNLALKERSGRSSKDKRKRRDIPRTPSEILAPQPPPPPPLAGASGALGSKALSLSKSAALASQSMAWTTSYTRYKSAGLFGTQELSPMDSLILDDSIPDEQTNPKGDQVRINVNQPLPLGGSLGHVTIQTHFFFNKDLEYIRYGSKGSSPALLISKMKARSYLDFGLELLVPEQIISILIDMLLCRTEIKSDQPCRFSVSSELKPTPGWDATGYEFKHDYTIIESPRVVVYPVNNNERKIMRFNEIYKFSDGMLTRILEALAYRVKEFKIKRLNLESEPSKKPSSTKETQKSKALTKGSKTGKSTFAKEPIEEPIAKVVMDDAGDDVACNDNQPQDTSEPKTRNTLNPNWFKQPPRPPTLDPEWNKDQNNLKGDRYSFDLSMPLPLQGPPGHRTVAIDCFFNNDLEYLKTSNPEVTYTISITKKKAAQYEIKGIENMVPILWSTIKHVYDKDAKKGIKYWGERRKLCTDLIRDYGENIWSSAFKFKEGDFVDIHLNDIKYMLLLAVQHKLFHLDRSVIVDFIVALRMFTRSLTLKRRVEDL
nr:hypothetical protein [Tanacetum cinerariifolium]